MASLTIPTQASALRIGDHMCVNDRPCKITGMTTSKTGKHGGAKIHFICVDIFTDKKYEPLHMSTQNIEVPHVTKNDYQLLDITDDEVSYLNDKEIAMNDLVMPCITDKDAQLSSDIRNAFDEGNEVFITVISAMDITAIKGFRVTK